MFSCLCWLIFLVVFVPAKPGPHSTLDYMLKHVDLDSFLNILFFIPQSYVYVDFRPFFHPIAAIFSFSPAHFKMDPTGQLL